MSGRLRALAMVAGLCVAGASLAGAPAALATAGDDARVVLVTSSANTGSSAGRTVQCGPGERAIGGGVGFNPSNSNWLSASGPRDETLTAAGTADGDVPRAWFSEAVNFTGTTQQYTHYAVCSASSDATIEVTAFSAAQAPNANGTYAQAPAECPPGERAIGGGLDYQGSIPAGKTQLDATAPLDAGGTSAGTESGDVIRFWFAEVTNLDLGAGHDYAVSAVCSASSQATVEVVTEQLSNPAPKLACTGGARATSGGAIQPLVDATTAPSLISFSGPTDAGGDTTLATGDAPLGWTTGLSHPLANSARFSVICDPPRPAAAATPAAPTVPAAGPTGQRSAALAKCKKKRSKKARRKCRRHAALLPA